MTQIDFHVNAPDKLAYACRLARKGYASGARMVFHSNDAAWLARFDDTLWTSSDVDFVPHCRARDPLAAETPIVLASSGDAESLPHHDVLVNLDRETPDVFGRFERLIEVADATREDLDAARARYKWYRDRGYPLTHNRVDDLGDAP